MRQGGMHDQVYRHHAHRMRFSLAVVVVLLGICCFAGTTQAQAPAIAATFVRNVTIPSLSESIVRPSSLHFDRFHRELYVADFGHNRIVIFAPSGAYKFDFQLTGGLTSPADVTTDPAGFIYVLGTMPEGRTLQCFDFDGVALHRVPLPVEINGQAVTIRSVACDDQGMLYALDHNARRILVLDPKAGLQRWFSADPKPGGSDGLLGLGTLAIDGDNLLIPAPTMGTILYFGTDGTFRKAVGTFGTKTGTLNFPVAAEVAPDGRLLVLDKNRFCVVVFDQDRIVGEFGGKGINPGWFMGPSLLAVPTADHVVVGQVFENKIQICNLPAFASGRAQAGAVDEAVGSRGDVPDSETAIARPARIPSHTSDPFAASAGEESPPRGSQPRSHLEVSE